MALPMIGEAREAFPGSSVTLLTPESLVDLFSANPAIDAILPIPREHVHGLLAVMKIKDILAPFTFDVGFILPPSFGSAASMKLAGIKERIGYIADGRRLLLSRPLPLPSPINSEHRSVLYFNLLRRACGADLEYGKPKLFLSDNDLARGGEVLAGFGLNEGQKYIAVAFRAVAESRRWGTERYIELIKAIISRHSLKVVLIGGNEDMAEGDKIVSSASPHEVINLAGKTTIRESAAVLAGANLFVGNDSGPAHLAASVGIPLVVLSGADDPKATSPIASTKKLVRMNHLDCIGCEKNSCPLPDNSRMACMTGITVEKVLGEIELIL
jgi:heptosyltransferase-2